ncbi:MAG: hypothetical protein QGG36_06910 [Pirellulaceae bacterium]|nr:hypothetical protein [Pirellulaceae bacterium]MDP7015511.1 hypothetical protein [Pirellulaceae bacterium]
MRTLLASLIACQVACLLSIPARADEQPNIVVILVDDKCDAMPY